MKLTSPQRKFLKSKGHHLKPLTRVGKAGVTEAFIKSVSQTLKDHELVKVKFNEFKDEKSSLADDIARQMSATLVAITGNVALLYKQSKDERKRKISLPDMDGPSILALTNQQEK